MKKISIMMLGLMGLFVASCDEAPEAPKPQENPQEPIFAVGDITSATDGVLASTAVLKLDDYAATDQVPVMKLTESTDLPQGATVSYVVELCADADFTSKVQKLDAKLGDDDVYYVSTTAWDAAHVALFGKSPKDKTAYYRVAVYVNLDGSNYRYAGDDFYAATGSIVEACLDHGFTIADHYYLIGEMNGWKLDESLPFIHSDADVYDDPVFTINFKVEKANSYWKIITHTTVETQDWSLVYGPEEDGSTAFTGTLTDTNAGAGDIVETGNYKMTINMETMTYTIEKLLRPEVIYTPGGANGWNQTNSAWMYFDKKQGYYGVFPVDGAGFKVCLEPKWDDKTDYGAETETPANSGTFVLGSAGKNIHPAAPGFYWFTAQYDEASGSLTTYAFTEITRVGVIGSFAASGWGSDIEMTPNADKTVWTADITLAAGDEYKVRFNNGWDLNLGKGDGHAAFDGGNFAAEEAGTFTVTLTVQPGAPTITLVKK